MRRPVARWPASCEKGHEIADLRTARASSQCHPTGPLA